MRLSYLELRNYRRFREVDVHFPDGIVGIIGPNGSGKTTLIEAVAWALFGNTEEVVRTSRESIKRAGAPGSESCRAALEFELGGTEYRVEREMGGKNLTMKASLRTGDTVLADGDRPVRKAVEKLIGMDHKSFFTSVFARQKELNALQNFAAGERKKAVLRMLRIDSIDGIMQKVRADRRDAEERIKGAESTLFDAQGRDREALIRSQLPALKASLEENQTLLKAAEESEAGAARDLEAVRRRRDDLKKDFEAYNTAARDLHGKKASAQELVQRAEVLDRRMAEAQAKLKLLPELAEAERSWTAATATADKMEEERRKDDRAKHIREDLRGDRKAMEEVAQELEETGKALAAGDDIAAQRRALEAAKEETARRRAELADVLGGLRARKRDREQAAQKDRAKLDEILRLGKEGTCPTCERVLEDAYELLVTKLRRSSEEAAEEVAEADAAAAKAQGELKGLEKREDALKKKASWLEQEEDKRRRAEAVAERLRRQLDQLKKEVGSKEKKLEAIGEVSFSEEAYEAARKERERLKPLHDDFVRLKGAEEETARVESERAEVRERARTLALETEALTRLIHELEPKKDEYNKISKSFDEKIELLSKAKDELRTRVSKRDEARNALSSAEKSLEEMEQVKKGIESQRKRKEGLAMLEDVISDFRDHLIAKVAPTLAELTSHVLEAATGGRYRRVELDEAYEILVDDDGEMHPLGRFSGGESDLANLALRLAISRIIAERTGANPINFLILDEIFGSLDPERKRDVMTALSALSAQFRQILLITHIEDVKDLMGNVMQVEQREDGTSSVSLVS